jgi:hypothetical protein
VISIHCHDLRKSRGKRRLHGLDERKKQNAIQFAVNESGSHALPTLDGSIIPQLSLNDLQKLGVAFISFSATH